MKKWIFLLCSLVLLGGCGAPAPAPEPVPAPEPAPAQQIAAQWLSDESHHAFYVNNHIVTVERAVEPSEDCKLILTVWDRGDPAVPLQTIHMAEDTRYDGDKWLDPAWSRVEDFNFDHFEDFGCVYAMGNQPVYYHVWLWDPEAGQYVYEPAFDELCYPAVDWAEEKIECYARGGAAGAQGDYSFYKWIDGTLTEVRHIKLDFEDWDDMDSHYVSVTDLIDGEMQEVFRYEGNDYFDTVELWRNLWYTGEN